MRKKSENKILKHGTPACYTHDKCRCPLCRRAIADWMHAWVIKTDYAYSKKRYSENTILINSFKDRPCVDCLKQYPSYVMQFDHVIGEKVADLCHMKQYSKEKILEEISKCEVVCANCHAERTHQRKELKKCLKMRALEGIMVKKG